MIRRVSLGLARLVLFAGAVGLAVVTGLGELGRHIHILDALNHFRPFYLAAAAALLAAVALVNNGRVLRRVSFWLAFLAVTVQAVHVVPELVASAAAASLERSDAAERGEVLRIVTFNLWGGNRRPEAAAAALRALDADVIVVQEASRAQKPLVDLVSSTHPYVWGCVAVRRCNVAILSRHPFTRTRMHRPQQSGSDSWIVPAVGADLEVRTSRGPLRASILTTHLTWPSHARLQRKQMGQVATAAREARPESTIVLGDFNSTPWSYGLDHLGRSLELRRVTLALPTWPAERMPGVLLGLRRIAAAHGVDLDALRRPFLPIDHAFVGRSLEVKAVWRAPIPGSDHFAVVLDVAVVSAAATENARLSARSP